MKRTSTKKAAEMRKEYDFSGGTVGKYAKAYTPGTKVVLLDQDGETAEMEAMSEDVDLLLRTAISQRRLIELTYYNKRRIVEPHDYGIRSGTGRLLAYQIGGASSGPLPNWRWMEVSLISDVRILDKAFRGGRPIPSGKHHKWDQLFIRVEPAQATK